MRLIFLLFFITLNSFSQRVLISDIQDINNFGVDSIHNELLIFYKDHYNSYDLKNYSKTQNTLYTEPDFNIKTYRFIMVDTLRYFVLRDGGLVYRFKNDSIKRIDNSFGHRMQTGSDLFAYKHRIYRYGGYGFWSVRNFFIYFDNKTKEWEVNPQVNSEEIPEGTYSSPFVFKNDIFYLFDGLKIDPHKRLERILNTEVWKYDFTTSKWEYLGDHKPLPNGVRIKYGEKILNIVTNNIEKIDVINNKIEFFEHNLISPKLNTSWESFYLDHQFYCFITKRGITSLKVMPENVFLSKKISQSSFYLNSIYWWSRTIIALLLAVALFSIWWFLKSRYKKQNKIRLLENGLRFKNKFIEFDEESMRILTLLLANDEVSSNQILGIVEKSQYSPAHNERLKVQKINDINLKVKTLLGISEDMVSSFKSSADRRIRIYRISKAYFGK